jgi:hypothetical protein
MGVVSIDHIAISCHGEFYFKADNIKGRKPFSQVIKAPNMDFFKQTAIRYTGTDDEGKLKFKETEFINVRGIIKKRLLPMLLPKKYPDFVRVRSVTIDEIQTPDGQSLELPVTLQSRNQLIELCRAKKIPVEAASYLNIDELRTDVLEYQADPEVFLQNMERKSKKRAEEKEFMALNDMIPETPAAETPKKITKPQPKGIVDL